VIFNVLLIFLILLGFSLFCCLFGASLITNSSFYKSIKSQHLKFSATFFLGSSIFIFIWKIIFLINDSYKTSFFLTLFIIILFLFLISKVNLALTEIRQCIIDKKTFLFALFFLVLSLCMSLVPFQNITLGKISHLDPWAGYSTVVHSFRAANISLFSVTNDIYPILHQNVAQSVLASVPLFFVNNGILISIFLFHSIVIFYSFIFFSHMSKEFLMIKKYNLFGVIIFLLPASLTLNYISITDVGSVFFLIHNIDVLMSIPLMILILMSAFFYKNSNDLYLTFFLIMSMSLFANHNLILLILFLLFCITLNLIHTKLLSNKLFFKFLKRSNTKLFLIIIFFSILSLSFSGSSMQMDSNFILPAVQSNKFKPDFNLNNIFIFKMFIWAKYSWYFELSYEEFFNYLIQIFNPVVTGIHYKFNVLTLFLTLFFPFSGYFSKIVITNRNLISNRATDNVFSFVYLFGLFSFFISSILILFINKGHSYLEYSRFWQLPLFIGCMTFVYTTFYIFESNVIKKYLIKFILYTLLTIGIFSSSIEISRWLIGNFVDTSPRMHFFGNTELEDNINMNLYDRLNFLNNFDNYDDFN
jgi:hypothetical protein